MLHSLLTPRNPRSPVSSYLLLAGGRAFFFSLIFTVNMIYQVTVVGLSPLQLVLVGTVLEATCFLFEVPTGIVADVISRRLSILIGFVLIGAGFTLEGVVPEFWAMLAGNVLWGIGYTFTSGAIEAWITDEIGEEAVGPVFLRGGQVGLIFGLLGTLASMLLALGHIQLPIILAGVGMLGIALALTLTLPETRMRPTPPEERSTFGHMVETARAGFAVASVHPVARTLILATFIYGLASEAIDRLNVPSILERFSFPKIFGSDDAVLWFGLSSVVATLLGLGVTEWVRRWNPAFLSAGSPARVLTLLAALEVAAVGIFALSGSLFLAFGMLWLRGVVGNVTYPVSAAWLNRNLSSETRATVISMTGQANAIGQVAGGPALGWVGSSVSIRAALLGATAILMPIVALYARQAQLQPSTLPGPIEESSPGEAGS